MKKIVLGITLLSSLLFCNDQWKNELDIHGGILNNSLSKETSKYFCEHTSKDSLANEILEHFKKQDLRFYNSHKSAIDVLPMQLIKSTEKSNLSCPSGYIATGSCGDWKCGKEEEIEIYHLKEQSFEISNEHFLSLCELTKEIAIDIEISSGNIFIN